MYMPYLPQRTGCTRPIKNSQVSSGHLKQITAHMTSLPNKVASVNGVLHASLKILQTCHQTETEQLALRDEHSVCFDCLMHALVGFWSGLLRRFRKEWSLREVRLGK